MTRSRVPFLPPGFPAAPAAKASPMAAFFKKKRASGEDALPPLLLPLKDIYLRPPRLADWAAWAELRSHSRDFLTPFEAQWAADALTLPAFRRRMRSYAEDWTDDRTYPLFIFRAADDRLLGAITVTNVRRGIVQGASLGYWVGASHARQGVMSAALLGALAFCFDHLKLHRVEAACLLNNTASRRVLEKTGFRQEGYARKYLKINGRWQDHQTFALLEEEYRSRSPRQKPSPA